jgi:hypothetical protein
VAIFTYPTSLIPQTASWGIQKAGVGFRSPMAGSYESVAFPGEFWRVAITLPAGKMRNGGEGEAFFGRLAGGVDRVLVPYWMRMAPRGTLRGTPVLASAAGRGDLVLNLTVAAGATLAAGDMLGAGGQLFQVFQACSAPGTALAVPLVNRVRATIAAGSPVIWQTPTVTCIVPSSFSQRSYEPAVASVMPIDLEEAP